MKMHILTGGPTNGKSTLIEQLKYLGNCVLEETSRKVLEERRNFVADYAERLFREREIFYRQCQREDEAIMRNNEMYFLDRGLVDVIAYCKHYLGHVPEDFKNIELKNRYGQVFILDRLPFVADGTRIEKDDEEAEEIHHLLIKTYKEFGYNPVHVPFFPIDKINDRINFILSHINKMKGGVENGRMLQ